MSDYLPEQSRHWDDVMPLEQMLQEAKFFVLRKRHPHGDLVDVILEEFDKSGQKWYRYRALSHDAEGVTCDADGSMKATFIEHYRERGLADITCERERVLRHIGEVMNCHPNVDKLFSEYDA